MFERRATVFVCDELLFSLTGKITVSGLYTGDIAIPREDTQVNQLVFFFTAECSVEDPFKHLTLRVTFPGQQPMLLPLPIILPPAPPANRTKISFKQPFLVQQVLLKPGRIETVVMHEKGETDAGGFWIALQTGMPAAST